MKKITEKVFTSLQNIKYNPEIGVTKWNYARSVAIFYVFYRGSKITTKRNNCMNETKVTRILNKEFSNRI